MADDNNMIDILEEFVRYGIYVFVTSEFKEKKMIRSKFIEMPWKQESGI